MALVDRVQARYSSQILINATNPQSTAAVSIDTARLGFAATDVEADFAIVGITYDNDVAMHYAVAVPGVMAKLLFYNGHMGGKEYHDSYLDRLDKLALVTSRNRITPTTDSLLSPTEDTMGDLPQTDRKAFKGFIPGASAEPTQD